MSHASIRDEVKALHEEIWHHQHLLWPDRHLTPQEMLEPDAAAYLLGIEYLLLPNLGSSRFIRPGEGSKIAGLIDRQSNKIAVSMEFSQQVQRFTGAHEIGHFLLHQGHVMHRDRPLDGSGMGTSRPKVELEADYFAATFLMPEKLLRSSFEDQFGCKGALKFDDRLSFHLNQNDPESLLFASSSTLDREYALARCERTVTGRRVSLADQFRVSASAMAIRLKELEFVRWP